MILCPLNGESLRKSVWVNNLLVRSKQLIKFVAILKPDVCIISGPHSEPYKFLLHILKNNPAAETAQTLDLARLLIYRYSIISEILSFGHSTVLILVSDGVTE